MKHTLLLFSKLPEVGLVKTRLTTLKDGIFEPEVASALYHCMLFDVVEICCDALAQLEARDAACDAACGAAGADEARETVGAGAAGASEYELVISTAPAANLDAMRALFEDAGTWPRDIVFRADRGMSFDEHYNDAFAQCWAAGSGCILSMGADMPALTVQDVVRGFDELDRLAAMQPGEQGEGLVLAPDQEMGVSIIGWTRATGFDHGGVFYNSEGLTVLPAYIEKARSVGLPVVWLPPVPDVDTMQDLFHNITLIEALNYTAPFSGNTPPWRTAQALEEMGWSEIRVMPNGLFDPRGKIDTAE